MKPPADPFGSAVVRVGPIVHVGMLLPAEGGRVVPGDAEAQTRRSLAGLAELLGEHGSAIDQVAHLLIVIRSAEELAGVDRACASVWRTSEPARTAVVACPPAPDARVAISGVALTRGAERTVIRPRGWSNPGGPWSYAIRSDDSLFASGLSCHMSPIRPAGEDVGAQTRALLQAAQELLEAARMSLDDVASARVFLDQPDLFEPMNAAYRPFFGAAPPARATVTAGRLHERDKVTIALLAVQGSDRAPVFPRAPDGSRRGGSPNYSPGIRVGSRLFASGRVGSGRREEVGMIGQTRAALAGITEVLEAGGFAPADVVDALVYLTDATRLDEVVRAFRDTFPAPGPTMTVMETGLVIPEPMVEIMLTAARQGA